MSLGVMTVILAAALAAVVLAIARSMKRRDRAVREANRNAEIRAQDIEDHKHRNMPA
jgi:hypothetical protein